MRDLLDQLARHVEATLGLAITPTPWDGGGHLLPFLRDRYAFFEVELFGAPGLLMVARDDRGDPPAAVRRHIDQVPPGARQWIIYVRRRVTGYDRKRLIEHKIPFIVPGNQIYLPPLGIDLRERFVKLQESRRRFRPASQAVLIHMLLHDDPDYGPAELVPRLGYSAMTISRALDELEVAELAEALPVGRERRVHLRGSKLAVWQTAQPLLRDPVQNRHWVWPGRDVARAGPHAGLTALARYSTLAALENAAIALSRRDWRLLRQRDVPAAAPADEPGALHLEVWSYTPALFAVDGCVDRLSLYLSLRESRDERIEAALERMMEQLSW